jgi:predicted transcriptional regulator
MGDLSDFESGQIVDARIAEASVTKTATLLGVWRAAVSKIKRRGTVGENQQ